jgi:hypothetical protein
MRLIRRPTTNNSALDTFNNFKRIVIPHDDEFSSGLAFGEVLLIFFNLGSSGGALMNDRKKRAMDARLHGGMFSQFTKVHLPTSVGLVQLLCRTNSSRPKGRAKSTGLETSLIRSHEELIILETGSKSQTRQFLKSMKNPLSIIVD